MKTSKNNAAVQNKMMTSKLQINDLRDNHDYACSNFTILIIDQDNECYDYLFHFHIVSRRSIL